MSAATLPAVAPTEPVTAAGKRLYQAMADLGLAHAPNGTVGLGIVAIENEAALAVLAVYARIRHEFRDLPLIVAVIDGMGETAEPAP